MTPTIMQRLVCSWLAAAVVVVAVQPPLDLSDYSVKERHDVPHQWTRIGSAPDAHVLDLQIGLAQSNFAELERHLYEVSDPDHARYGQHLTEDAVNALVQPHASTSRLVHEWLEEAGVHAGRIKYSTPSRDWIAISMPVREVEYLLNTTFHVYRHNQDGAELVRTPEYSLPRHLHAHIDTVTPTNSFFRAKPKAKLVRRSTNFIPVETVGAIEALTTNDVTIESTDSIASACNFTAVTPKCLRTLYGTINYKAQVPGRNRVGLANYLNETNNRSDVALFLSRYRPEAVAAAKDFKTIVIQGGQDQQTQLSKAQLAAGQDLEGNLDAEYILGIGYPTPLTAFNTGG